MTRPERKHPRLKNYDYSQPGYYYVTIHTAVSAPALSRILPQTVPQIQLTQHGETAERQLLDLPRRYPNVRVDKYVIMPTHIHVILQLLQPPAGTGGPSLTDVICAYKSLTTRQCNQWENMPGRKLFQTSFYETVLRNEQAYQKCWRYIDGNPGQWLEKPENR